MKHGNQIPKEDVTGQIAAGSAHIAGPWSWVLVCLSLNPPTDWP
jgi:hypothetical protein